MQVYHQKSHPNWMRLFLSSSFPFEASTLVYYIETVLRKKKE